METNSFDEIAEEAAAKTPQSSYSELYSAPRRFDLATMLVVTTAFALLFTGMTVLDFNFWLFLYFACLIVVVGVCQSLFVPRYCPRRVSLVAGFSYQLALMTLFSLYALVLANKFSGQLLRGLDGFSCPFFGLLLLSPVLGYLSGVLVAGTFLVADRLRGGLGLMRRNRKADGDQHGASSPWDE